MNIAIVEDEWDCADSLKKCLQKYTDEFGVQFCVEHFSRGTEFLFNYKPKYDLVFMDVDMPEMNGFVTAKKLREMDETVELVFVTYLSKYAYRGYEVDAMDYMLKPVTYDALKLKIGKAISRCKQKETKIVLLPTSEGEVRLAEQSILYVEISGHNVVYHTDKGTHTYYGTMKNVEKILPEKYFVRCNNCYLINLNCVDRVDGDNVIVGTNVLPISRPRKKAFVEALHQYIIGGGL